MSKINLSIVLTNFIISLIFLNSILKSLIDDELILNISFTYLYVFFINIILIFIFFFIKKFFKIEKFKHYLFFNFFVFKFFGISFIKL